MFVYFSHKTKKKFRLFSRSFMCSVSNCFVVKIYKIFKKKCLHKQMQWNEIEITLFTRKKNEYKTVFVYFFSFCFCFVIARCELFSLETESFKSKRCQSSKFNVSKWLSWAKKFSLNEIPMKSSIHKIFFKKNANRILSE